VHKALIFALAGAALVFFITTRPAGAANSCVGLSTTPISFGAYNPSSPTDLIGVGSITYTCSLAAAIVVQISAGNSLTCTARYMLAGTARLNYNLYIDAAHTLVWGTTTPGCGTTRTDTVLGNTAQTDTIFGLIPQGQNGSPSGTYSDSLTVTITF